MTQMTALQITQLNNCNEAHQRPGIGTRLNAMEFGTAVAPSVGTLTNAPVLHYNLTTPYIGTATKCHAAVTLAQAVTTTVSTGFTQPDFPRILSVKGSDTNVTGNCVFTGTDINDAVITETIVVSSNTEDFGVKAFKTITSVVLPVYNTGASESISIGMGDSFGFPLAISNTALVLAADFDGSADGGSVTVGATAALSLYVMSGTLDGAKDVDLWFIAD